LWIQTATGNDDALRAIRLFTSKIADAVLTGKQQYERTQIADQKAEEGLEPVEKVEFVDTSAYEKYEKQEGDFVDAEPVDAAVPAEVTASDEEASAEQPSETATKK
jgi:hypothetical protein